MTKACSMNKLVEKITSLFVKILCCVCFFGGEAIFFCGHIVCAAHTNALSCISCMSHRGFTVERSGGLYSRPAHALLALHLK